MPIRSFMKQNGFSSVRVCTTPDEAIALLGTFYSEQQATVVDGAKKIDAGASPSSVNLDGYYPAVGFDIDVPTRLDPYASFGICRRGPGMYASTIGALDVPHYREYVREQIALVMSNYSVPAYVALSPLAMPFGLIQHSARLAVKPETQREFPAIDMGDIGPVTTLRKTQQERCLRGTRPFANFSGAATHFGVCRTEYYTGVPASELQRLVMLVNYPMFEEIFIDLGTKAVEAGTYEKMTKPENGTSRRRPQMPAVNLIRPDGNGITLINIGVGPSNPVTLIECLQVLRPHALTMVGHAAGLHPTQRIGQFLLAETYIRRDRILDRILPLSTAIAPVAEINTAHKRSCEEEMKIDANARREVIQTGPVVSENRRLWELDRRARREIQDTRAVGLDMESTAAAAACWLGRIPFGTFLCVSDLPFHSGPKLTSSTHQFYESTAELQMRIAIRAFEMLRENVLTVHSRKLRHPLDPPCR